VRILAIETSTRHCSVALAHPHTVVQRSQAAGDRVAERALSMIAELLADESLGLEQIDAFAFGSGPGAFTGLRVAGRLSRSAACGRSPSVRHSARSSAPRRPGRGRAAPRPA
jgi:tRNA threonylcarbamoyladenosine biosynthesis protein TsaB